MAENIISLPTHPARPENELDYVEPLMLMQQAKTVMTVAFRAADHRANQYWGLKLLIDGVANDVEAVRKSPNEVTYDKASNSLQAALSLMTAYNDDEVDDLLLYAVSTILCVAKGKIDDAWQAFEHSALEVQHG